MKRLIALFLTLVLAFSLVACRNGDENKKDDDVNDLIQDALNGNGAIETPITDLP